MSLSADTTTRRDSAPGPRRGREPLRVVTRALRIRPRALAAAVAAASVTLLCALALAVLSAWLITRAWQQPSVMDLTVAVTAVRALGLSRAVFRYLDRLLTHDVALRGVVELRTGLYEALAAAPTERVAALRRGDLLARLGDDVAELGDHVVRTLVPGLVAAVLALAATGLIATWSPVAAGFVALGLVIACVLGPVPAYRAARLSEAATLDARGDLSAGALTALEHAAELRVAGAWSAQQRVVARAQGAFDAAIDRAAAPSALALGAVPLGTAVATLGSLLAAAAAFAAGGLSVTEAGILVLTPLSVFEAAGSLPGAASQLARSRAAAGRLLDLTGGELAPASDSAAEAAPHPAGASHRTGVPRLTTHDLSVGWRADRVLAEGLELDLAPGSRTAVVGPTGIGKSTLLLTLAGLLRPLAGQVRLDGADLAGLAERDARAAIGLFSEDAHVFATTVRENLKVARGDVTDAEAIAALRSVGLGAWLDEHGEGLDLMLTSDGATVSGGERRRLLLARAVMSRAPVVLLDEPTEHLEAAEGDALLDALLRRDAGLLAPEQTLVLVTHRAGAVAAADHVVPLVPPARA